MLQRWPSRARQMRTQDGPPLPVGEQLHRLRKPQVFLFAVSLRALCIDRCRHLYVRVGLVVDTRGRERVLDGWPPRGRSGGLHIVRINDHLSRLPYYAHGVCVYYFGIHGSQQKGPSGRPSSRAYPAEDWLRRRPLQERLRRTRSTTFAVVGTFLLVSRGYGRPNIV